MDNYNSGGGVMIKRYDVCEQNGNEYETENGRFVLYEDHKEADVRNHEDVISLAKNYNALIEKHIPMTQSYSKLIGEHYKLKKEIEYLKDYFVDLDLTKIAKGKIQMILDKYTKKDIDNRIY